VGQIERWALDLSNQLVSETADLVLADPGGAASQHDRSLRPLRHRNDDAAARDMILLMSRCAEAKQWSIEDADAWWGRHERGQGAAVRPAAASAAPTSVHGHDVTIDLSVKRG
jgi:hypothetical protein